MVNPIPQPQRVEVLDTLLEKADLQGYLTTGDILEVFPWDGEEDEHLLELFGLLHRQGVEIVVEEDTESEPDLSKLDSSALEFNPASLEPSMLTNLENISADDSVGLYLKEMSRVPLLSLEEEVSLAQRIERAKDCKARLSRMNGKDQANIAQS
jgi:RNA polymerase primary sigma factor